VTLYRVVRAVVVAVCRLLFRVTVEGQEHLPATGAYVLAPVHRSFVDFGIVVGVTHRRLRYMGKDSLWSWRPFGAFLTALGAFPVHRGAVDREAFRRSIEVLAEGDPLVLFPEGTRRRGPVVEDLFEGAAYVAARAGIPVVPVGIGGSERAQPKGTRLPRPAKVHVVVGEPLPPPPPKPSGQVSRRAVHELTLRLQQELQQLFDQAQTQAGVVSSSP
jgi:1-acyl-sn-glycerol-3-phosphate acyltransferase